jgi:hypothetical protein
MMGVRAPETRLAVNKRQDNKLEKVLHLVGDLFEVFSACITQFVCNTEEFLISIHNGLHTEYQCYQDIFYRFIVLRFLQSVIDGWQPFTLVWPFFDH